MNRPWKGRLLTALASLLAFGSLPATELPPILEGVTIPEGLQALAVSRAGDRAALSFVNDPEAKSVRSTLRLYSSEADEPATVEVPGVLRVLRFVEPDPSLFAVQHRPARKREGETSLLAIDPDTLEVRHLLRLPPTARWLDYWPREHALLVAAHNEIRTLLLPLMRSGPLFRIPGNNLAVVSLGGTRILVGQDIELHDLDLSDPPDRERLPPRQTIRVPSPVVTLVLAADGTHALAGLADRSIARITFDPLHLEITGTGVLPSRPVEAPEPPAAPLRSAPPETSTIAVSDDNPAGRETGPEAPERPAAHGSFESPPIPEVSEAPEVLVAPDATEAAEPPPVAPSTSAQAWGNVFGPSAQHVVAVVLLGPDNILREAARATPSPAGRWEIEGLPPGRYRVQLDGGGGRVLVTEPPFYLLEVSDSQETVTAHFNVLRTH